MGSKIDFEVYYKQSKDLKEPGSKLTTVLADIHYIKYESGVAIPTHTAVTFSGYVSTNFNKGMSCLYL